MNAYWLSWWWAPDIGEFELHSPWWISGQRLDGARSVVAAIRAPDEAAAKQVVMESHEAPPASIEWRFCERRPEDWAPFCDRLPRADWMQWP